MSNKIIKVKSKRYQLQCQIFSCQALTSSVGQIVSNLLLQGFHLLDRADRFQTFSGKAFSSSVGQIVSNLLWQGFDFIDREDRFKPSLARL